MKHLIIPALLALASCDDGEVFHVPQDPAQPSSWEIGPIVRGENRSPRSERVDYPGALLAVAIPHGPAVGDKVGELSGVTFVHGPLTGKTRIRARFRIEAEPGVRILTSQHTESSAAVLFFQHRGDPWTAVGDYEDYRWYSVFAQATPLEVNRVYEMDVPLDGAWNSTTKSSPNPAGFAEAIANTERVGIVFGGGEGAAHGIYATGPATFILEAFEVQ